AATLRWHQLSLHHIYLMLRPFYPLVDNAHGIATYNSFGIDAAHVEAGDLVAFATAPTITTVHVPNDFIVRNGRNVAVEEDVEAAAVSYKIADEIKWRAFIDAHGLPRDIVRVAPGVGIGAVILATGMVSPLVRGFFIQLIEASKNNVYIVTGADDGRLIRIRNRGRRN